MYGPETGAGTLDDPPFVLDQPEKELCFSQAQKVVRYLMEHVFP
jgi:hypothetical protein